MTEVLKCQDTVLNAKAVVFIPSFPTSSTSLIESSTSDRNHKDVEERQRNHSIIIDRSIKNKKTQGLVTNRKDRGAKRNQIAKQGAGDNIVSLNSHNDRNRRQRYTENTVIQREDSNSNSQKKNSGGRIQSLNESTTEQYQKQISVERTDQEEVDSSNIQKNGSSGSIPNQSLKESISRQCRKQNSIIIERTDQEEVSSSRIQKNDSSGRMKNHFQQEGISKEHRKLNSIIIGRTDQKEVSSGCSQKDNDSRRTQIRFQKDRNRNNNQKNDQQNNAGDINGKSRRREQFLIKANPTNVIHQPDKSECGNSDFKQLIVAPTVSAEEIQDRFQDQFQDQFPSLCEVSSSSKNSKASIVSKIGNKDFPTAKELNQLGLSYLALVSRQIEEERQRKIAESAAKESNASWYYRSSSRPEVPLISSYPSDKPNPNPNPNRIHSADSEGINPYSSDKDLSASKVDSTEIDSTNVLSVADTIPGSDSNLLYSNPNPDPNPNPNPNPNPTPNHVMFASKSAAEKWKGKWLEIARLRKEEKNQDAVDKIQQQIPSRLNGAISIENRTQKHWHNVLSYSEQQSHPPSIAMISSNPNPNPNPNSTTSTSSPILHNTSNSFHSSNPNPNPNPNSTSSNVLSTTTSIKSSLPPESTSLKRLFEAFKWWTAVRFNDHVTVLEMLAAGFRSDLCFIYSNYLSDCQEIIRTEEESKLNEPDKMLRVKAVAVLEKCTILYSGRNSFSMGGLNFSLSLSLSLSLSHSLSHSHSLTLTLTLTLTTLCSGRKSVSKGSSSNGY
jgi:hypothetical protein